MTRYLLFSIAVCLTFLNHATAQQPSYGYRFKVIDANGKFITDADSLFSISSIRPDGSRCSSLSYGDHNGRAETAFYESWMLYEYYNHIREFHLIRILNKKSRDTMTIFYKKYSKYQTYADEHQHPPDVIKFTKGYFVLHNRPSLKDWNMKGKSEKIIQAFNQTNFRNYIENDVSVRRSNNSWLFVKFNYETEPPAPIDRSRFTNLAYPGYSGQKTGKIVVFFIVEKDGRLTNVIPGVKGTTLLDEDLNQKCEEAVMKARFLKSDKTIQSGTVVFNFKLKE